MRIEEALWVNEQIGCALGNPDVLIKFRLSEEYNQCFRNF
jgi:hypothetical protein